MTVVIGGNGAGKTSWVAYKENRSKLPGTFYNADTLARGLGDWNDSEKQRKAREIVDKDIDEKLKNSDDGRCPGLAIRRLCRGHAMVMP